VVGNMGRNMPMTPIATQSVPQTMSKVLSISFIRCRPFRALIPGTPYVFRPDRDRNEPRIVPKSVSCPQNTPNTLSLPGLCTRLLARPRRAPVPEGRVAEEAPGARKRGGKSTAAAGNAWIIQARIPQYPSKLLPTPRDAAAQCKRASRRGMSASLAMPELNLSIDAARNSGLGIWRRACSMFVSSIQPGMGVTPAYSERGFV